MKKKTKFSNYEVDINPFIEPIWITIREYQTTSGYTQNRLKWAIDRLLRFATDGKPKYVSQKVANIFLLEYPNESPFNLRYDIRYNYGEVTTNSKRKSRLLLEHTTPINQVIDNLIKTNTRDEVVEILNNYSGVCVILREEDDLLNKSGFSKKRSNGWEDSYSKCGITIITEEEFNQKRIVCESC